jgi:hypothetical protein
MNSKNAEGIAEWNGRDCTHETLDAILLWQWTSTQFGPLQAFSLIFVLFSFLLLSLQYFFPFFGLSEPSSLVNLFLSTLEL